MSTPPIIRSSLRERLDNAAARPRWLCDAAARVCLGDLQSGTSLGGRAGSLAGRSVLVAARSQRAAALALIELDGVASRLIVCTPDLPPEHIRGVVEKGGVNAIVSDREAGEDGLPIALRVRTDGTITPARGAAPGGHS